jgi:hypothetical protein
MPKAQAESLELDDSYFDKSNDAPIEMMAGVREEQVRRPEFTLRPMTRVRKQHVMVPDKDEAGKTLGFKLKLEERTVDGYMMRCMKGHSQFITKEQLIERGLDKKLVRVYKEGADEPVAQLRPKAVINLEEEVA